MIVEPLLRLALRLHLDEYWQRRFALVGQLSFNAMLVASFTTIVFNANPLLRYDGYYILSDFLEIPQSPAERAIEYTMGLLESRHIFGIKLQQPLPPVLQRFWLFMYAVCSSIYRTFVGVVIILLVAYQIPILGMLMAIGGVATQGRGAGLVVKIFKYLAPPPPPPPPPPPRTSSQAHPGHRLHTCRHRSHCRRRWFHSIPDARR